MLLYIAIKGAKAEGAEMLRVQKVSIPSLSSHF